MNTAQLMVSCLESEGVQYIFGVPGEENEDFLFALEESGIQFIPVRHEQGAAFMADVWGRLSGKAGVCMSTLGPGATNLMTGVADANLDKAPLIAITGQGNLDRLHHESHQVLDVVKMMEPITKWNCAIKESVVVPEVVRKAFKLAQAEKPGACHIELPEDIAGMDVSDELTPLTIYEVRRPGPDDKVIAQTVQALKMAEKPLILAGNGAVRTRASKALTSFVTKMNIPVASSFMGKGAVSDREKVSLGSVGLGFKDYIIEAFEKSDLIICIGYDIAEYDPVQWNPDGYKKIIHLDFEPAEVYNHYIPEIEVIGDIASSVKAIDHQLNRQSFPGWYENIRQRIHDSIASFELPMESETFHVPGIIHIVRQHLPDHGLVISDVGSHKMWIARNFLTYCSHGCLISNGLASMGISLPGGIAAKLLDRERPVVCMMGDGGALMNIQELETAHRLNIGCIFLIMNDDNYGLIEWKQERNRNESFGTKIGNPDYVALARSFGIKGYKPSNAAELEKIIGENIDTEVPVVIEVPITSDVNYHLTNTLEEYFKSNSYGHHNNH